MEVKQEETLERAGNGWPFPKNTDSFTRRIIERYEPITPEFEQELQDARAKMASAVTEQERIAAELREATRRVNFACAEYRGVVQRLNEWRAALAKAGA